MLDMGLQLRGRYSPPKNQEVSTGVEGSEFERGRLGNNFKKYKKQGLARAPFTGGVPLESGTSVLPFGRDS